MTCVFCLDSQAIHICGVVSSDVLPYHFVGLRVYRIYRVSEHSRSSLTLIYLLDSRHWFPIVLNALLLDPLLVDVMSLLLLPLSSNHRQRIQ